MRIWTKNVGTFLAFRGYNFALKSDFGFRGYNYLRKETYFGLRGYNFAKNRTFLVYRGYNFAKQATDFGFRGYNFACNKMSRFFKGLPKAEFIAGREQRGTVTTALLLLFTILHLVSSFLIKKAGTQIIVKTCFRGLFVFAQFSWPCI